VVRGTTKYRKGCTGKKPGTGTTKYTNHTKKEKAGSYFVSLVCFVVDIRRNLAA